MGGCAGTHAPSGVGVMVEQPLPLAVANAELIEQPATSPASGQDKSTLSTSRSQLICAAAKADEELAKPNAEVYIGIPECKAQDEALSASEISLGVAEESPGRDAGAELLAKTLLQDLARSQGHGPKLSSPAGNATKGEQETAGVQESASRPPTSRAPGDQELGEGKRNVPQLPIGRSKSKQEPGEARRNAPQLPIGNAKSGQEPLLPILPRARSAPVMLPAAAVRSRSLPPLEAAEASPSPAAAAALLLPEKKSPTTALALSRRRKRRSVTFGGAECREFMVDIQAEEPCPADDEPAA